MGREKRGWQKEGKKKQEQKQHTGIRFSQKLYLCSLAQCYRSSLSIAVALTSHLAKQHVVYRTMMVLQIPMDVRDYSWRKQFQKTTGPVLLSSPPLHSSSKATLPLLQPHSLNNLSGLKPSTRQILLTVCNQIIIIIIKNTQAQKTNLLYRKPERAINESLPHSPFLLTSHSAFFCLLGILQRWYVGPLM